MQCTQVLYDSAEESAYVHREPRVEGILEVNGKSFNVMTGENIIGRDPELCSIVLQFQSISAEHAKIDAGPDAHTLSDMGSRNKTKLKEKVLKPYIQYFLENGDTIVFADVKAAYHISPEQDEKTNGDSDVIPETPARLPRSVIDKSVVIPETPYAMDTSGLDESFVPSSQSATENTPKNISATSETSFVASSQPPPRPSTSGAQHNNDVETPVAQRDSSRLRSSCESQASLRLALSESLTENDTSSRSLEDRTEADATNAHGRNIYEAETQMITFSDSNVKETPDKPNSQSNTPDLDESSLYGADTQIVFSPDTFKKPTNRNVGRLSLAKQNRSPNLGSANESIYEADTQLIFSSDVDSPTVERGIENGTPGREERLYEANTQVLSSPKSHRSATKKVQFSVENGSDDGTPKRRKEGVYAAEAKVFPHSDIREEVYEAETQDLPGLVGKDPASESENLYEAETQVLPGFVGKDPASESENLYEAETQVLPGFVGKDPASESENLYETETQVLPGFVGKDPASESEKLYEAETHVLPGLVRKDPASESEKLHEAETQVLPRLVGKDPASESEKLYEDETQVLPGLVKKDVVYETETQLLSDKDTGSAEVEDKSIYNAETQAIPENPSNKKSKSDSPRQSGAKPNKDSGRVCGNLKGNLDGKAAPFSSEKENCESGSENDIYGKATQVIPRGVTPGGSEDDDTNKEVGEVRKNRASAGKAGSMKTSVRASDSSDTDAEELQPRKIQKNVGDGYLVNISGSSRRNGRRELRKKGSASAGKAENWKTSVPASDSDDIDTEELKARPIRKKGCASAGKVENLKTSLPASDSDDTDCEDMFPRPTRKIDKSEAQPASEEKADDGDETDEENIFDCPTQKINPKTPTKPEDKKTSETKDSDETDEEDVFTIPTQKITKKVPKKTEQDKKTPSHLFKAKNSEERDEENIFDCQTQKIEPKEQPHSKPEDKKTSEAEDSDETDDEDMFTVPTQQVTPNPPKKREQDKKTPSHLLCKAKDSAESDEENIFNCPTQRIEPKEQPHSKTKDTKTSEAEDSDETDDEDMFTVPTQQVTPNALKKTEQDKKTPHLLCKAKNSEGVDEENIFNCPTQRIEPKDQPHSKPKDKKTSEAEDSDETDDEDMFTVPTQPVTPNALKKTEQNKKTPSHLLFKAKNSEGVDEENIFDCPTQKIEPNVQPHSKPEDDKTSEAKDSDEDVFTCPTQKVTPKSPTKTGDQKTSQANDGDKEDIFNCPTQKIPDDKKSINSSTEMIETVTDAVTESTPIDDDNSNDSDTLLRNYKEDEEEMSQLPDSDSIGEALSPDEAVHSRESTPDNLATSVTNAVGARHDTSDVKRAEERIQERVEVLRDERTEEPSKERTEELVEKPSKEQVEELREERNKRRTRLRRVVKTEDLGKEQRKDHTEQLCKEVCEEQTKEQAIERRKEQTEELGKKRSEEGTEERHEERSEESKDVLESAEPLPVEDKLDISLQEASEITKSKQRGPEVTTAVSTEEDQQKRKRGRPKKSSSRFSVTAPSILEKSSQNDVTPAENKSEISETPVQEEEVSASSQQRKSGRARNTTSTASKVSKQEPQLEPSHSRSEEVTEKPVEGFDNEERVLPGRSDTPKPKRGKVGKTSSQTLVTESKPTQKLNSAEKCVESDNEEDIVAPRTAESPRPKRGKLAKTSPQTVVPKSKTTEKLRQSSMEKLVEKHGNKEDKLLPSILESSRPKRGKLGKTSSQTVVSESKTTEKLRQSSVENLVEERSNKEDKHLPGLSECPRPKRGKLAKTSSQTLVAESKPTEKLRSAGKPVESESEEDGVMPSVPTSPRPKRGKQANTSSETSVAESKPTEKLRQSSMEEFVEKRVNEEDILLSGSSESPRPKRGNLATLTAESKLAEKLRQSLVEKNEEKQDNKEDKVLPATSESPRPKRGKQAKTSTQNLVAESKLTEKLPQSSSEKSVEKRDSEERVLPSGSESPRLKRGRTSGASSQTLIAEPKPSKKLSQTSTEKPAEKRSNEEDSPLLVSSGFSRSKKGRFTKKVFPLTSEAERISKREETAGTSRQSGIKRSSLQKDDEKRPKRVKTQEVPAIDENVQKLKSKRKLYSPRGPDKVVHDSEEENDGVKREDSSSPQDEPSSEDTATRRSGRVKKPTWKIRGGDASLTKKFVLSYSQDTEDVAAAESSEEDSSAKSKGRGRPKKSSLTPKESPHESRQKKVDIDAQPRSKTGQIASKRKKDAEEEPTPSKSQKLDAPRRASKARVSKIDPEDSDRESVCSEAGAVERRPGHGRRRLDSSDSVQSTPLTRSSSMMSETQSPSRRSVQRQAKQIHRVLFTGFADGRLEKQVLQLGAKIVDSVDGATVAVTDKLRRTVKLLSMMARGQPIVSPDWIRQSEKAGQFRDPWECLLLDADAEKKFDFTMERSLRVASNKKLLEGYTIFVTKNVSPPPDAMEEIIKSSGGVMVKKLLPNWPEKSVIISCQNDAAQLKKIRKPPPIVVAEWLLSGVLQQRLDMQNYKLS